MKVHLVIETFSTGHSIVYGAFSSLAKATACIDYIVDCCVKEDWTAVWEQNPCVGVHEVSLKCPREVQHNTASYHVVTREVK